MFGQKKDDYQEPEQVTSESSSEEYEFYDMSEFEKKVFRKMSVLEDKIDAVLTETQDNNHKLKAIQFQFTRALIIRLIRLAVIVGVLYLVYINVLAPLLERATNAYSSFEQVQMRLDADPNASIIDQVQQFFPGQNGNGNEALN